MRTKIITEPHELYRLLSTPGVNETNLVFASDDVAWLSWKVTAEEIVPQLPHTNEVIAAYVTAGARIHLYSFSTGYKRTLCIVTHTPLDLFSRAVNRGRSQMGTKWGHAILTQTLRIYCSVRIRWSKNLCIHADHQ